MEKTQIRLDSQKVDLNGIEEKMYGSSFYSIHRMMKGNFNLNAAGKNQRDKTANPDPCGIAQ